MYSPVLVFKKSSYTVIHKYSQMLLNYKIGFQRDINFLSISKLIFQRSEVFGVAVDEEEGDEDGDRSGDNLHHLLAPLPRLPAHEDIRGTGADRGRVQHRRRVTVHTRVR